MKSFLSRIATGVQMAVVCLVLLIVIGCNAMRVTDNHSPITPETEPEAYGGWRAVARGIERRDMGLATASQTTQGRAVLVRLDPAVVTFRVHYSPGVPRWLAEWRDQLPQAAVIVNGGFFDESDQALGLLVSDGMSSGQSFVGFGGMFQVTDSVVRVRSLVGEPYQGEPLLQAVQAFPMLIDPARMPALEGDEYNQRSRRAWVGQDRAGRIILGVTHNLISLAELQRWLLSSDLELQAAFALDGGRSAGLLVHVPGTDETYPAVDRLPAVIAVYSP
ncbi:MAG TPA: phosphodiester glycosidase family protein [Aggregatilineaceae bacterium]|nr:phosphodiester glycosidase family protein [Aggregatilineaceae bacterium]